MTTYGAQAGLLRFVAPAAALRAEARWRRQNRPGARAATTLLVVLDPYVGGPVGRGLRWAPPALGALDVDLGASASLTPTRAYSARLTMSPFLARWAQAGVRSFGAYFPGSPNPSAYELTGFGRLYVPLAGRTAPYVEGFATSGTYGSDDGGLSRYGAVAGVRRYAGPNAAAELGLAREWTPPYRFPNGGPTFRFPPTTALRLGMVTHLRRGRAVRAE